MSENKPAPDAGRLTAESLIAELKRLQDTVVMPLCVYEEEDIRSAESLFDLIPSIIAELAAKQAEVERLKRGDFTPEEFQNLCHHKDEKPGCTPAEFNQGCEEYQRKLFGTADVDGLRKANELLNKGMESICEGRDELKHENRSLRAELAASRAKVEEIDAELDDLRKTAWDRFVAMRDRAEAAEKREKALVAYVSDSAKRDHTCNGVESLHCFVCRAAALLATAQEPQA